MSLKLDYPMEWRWGFAKQKRGGDNSVWCSRNWLPELAELVGSSVYECPIGDMFGKKWCITLNRNTWFGRIMFALAKAEGDAQHWGKGPAAESDNVAPPSLSDIR